MIFPLQRLMIVEKTLQRGTLLSEFDSSSSEEASMTLQARFHQMKCKVHLQLPKK